jgi:hypothetical protein
LKTLCLTKTRWMSFAVTLKVWRLRLSCLTRGFGECKGLLLEVREFFSRAND